MKRGDIYYANLNPTLGSEIAKHRPVLIISNDRNNRASDTVTIVPITSNIEHVYPFEVFLAAGDSWLAQTVQSTAPTNPHDLKAAFGQSAMWSNWSRFDGTD